jgi:hypothetical protein
MRADNILVRNQADAFLGDARAAFRRAEAGFRSLHLAAAARGQDGPDQDRLAELGSFQTMLAELESCCERLRSASVPPPNGITRRSLSEARLLERLEQCDVGLAALALRDDAQSIRPAGLGSLTILTESHLRELHEVLHGRERLLGLMQS